MRIKSTILAVTVATAFAIPAAAQVSFDGWLQYEYDDHGTDTYYRARTNSLLSYGITDWTLGVGISHEYSKEPGDPAYLDHGGFYYLIGYSNLTVTYGDIWGAGNIFPEDYFGIDDATSKYDGTLRIDYEIDGHAFAVSYDFGDRGNQDFELGYRGRIGSFDVVAGYEGDQQQLGVIVGQDRGNWGWQVVFHEDFDDFGTKDQYGITAFYDVLDNLNVAANYAIDGDGDLHSYGILATYTAGFGTFKAEYVWDEPGDESLFEVGLIIPFGSGQPSGVSRFAPKEYNRGLIYRGSGG